MSVVGNKDVRISPAGSVGVCDRPTESTSKYKYLYFRICRWKVPLISIFVFGLVCLITFSIASAQEPMADQIQIKAFPLAQIFTFLFLMLGPFKIIGPFSKITKGADRELIRKIALLSIFFSSLALLFAALLGEKILGSYGIPLPILALAAGIILLLVALKNTIQQFMPHTHADDESAKQEPAPTLNLALTPLAFPTIVTPYGIATLIVFLALSPEQHDRLMIGAIVLAIMLLNLSVMFLTRHIPLFLGVLLQILGAVLGVVQVALGVQIIHNSLKALSLI